MAYKISFTKTILDNDSEKVNILNEESYEQ